MADDQSFDHAASAHEFIRHGRMQVVGKWGGFLNARCFGRQSFRSRHQRGRAIVNAMRCNGSPRRGRSGRQQMDMTTTKSGGWWSERRVSERGWWIWRAAVAERHGACSWSCLHSVGGLQGCQGGARRGPGAGGWELGRGLRGCALRTTAGGWRRVCGEGRRRATSSADRRPGRRRNRPGWRGVDDRGRAGVPCSRTRRAICAACGACSRRGIVDA
ncbi:hypothetical protein B0J12DRAFT_749703, partial [Macrophomina phaseolina]